MSAYWPLCLHIPPGLNIAQRVIYNTAQPFYQGMNKNQNAITFHKLNLTLAAWTFRASKTIQMSFC